MSSKKAAAPATMHDVAERAKVSAMTVSRALREPGKVSKETRARIARAIRDTGFIPNAQAGSLKAAQGSPLVAVILPTLADALFTTTLQGVADGLRKSGLHLMVGDSARSATQEEELVRAFLAQRPRGLVLHETVHSRETRRLLQRSKLPIVEVGDLTETPLDSVVSFSNFLGAKTMTRHLLACGYRRIAFVSLPLEANVRSRKRFEGHAKALEEAGIALDPALTREAGGSLADGAQQVAELVNAGLGIDVIFFAGGLLAVGALIECSRRGWDVPQKIGIASFDELPAGSFLEPKLTCLDIPRYEMGTTAAAVILERSLAKDARARVIDVGFSLMARESTRSP